MPRLLHLTSLSDLRSLASAWDDLWWRSAVTLPTARAELTAIWIERFALGARFHALVVEDQGRWVAALPLVRRRFGRVFEVANLPTGAWSAGGQLLWDPDEAVSEDVAAMLVEAMRRLNCPLLWLEDIELQRPGWQAVTDAIETAGMARDCRARETVARIEIDHDWEGYRGSWSRKHRQKMNACLRHLAARGKTRLRLLSQLHPDEVELWLRRGFLVEDRSWKGAAGSSVLRTPAMFDFFLRQSRQAAQWGQLELALLECGGRFTAFAYGLTGKGVFHSCKIGYDPEYADCAPGQLLRYHLLEQFHAEPDRQAIDFLGPMTASHACWRPGTYAVSRLAIAPRGGLGGAAIGIYRWLRPVRDVTDPREVRRTKCTTASPESAGRAGV